jgi:trk system potassium uptake protein TrkA
MKAIIVGGGKVGYYLLKMLKDKKYEITLIEKSRKICDKIAEDFNIAIICGDGTDLDVLKDAGIEDAEVVAAVTGKDEENLVICQITKNTFSVNKTIARVNNPKNRLIFKTLGVDNTVCSTEVIANIIEGQFAGNRLKVIQTLDRGEIILVEVIINKNSICCNRIISSLELPVECVIVSIIRNEKVIFPKGGIEIVEGDKLLITTNIEKLKEVEKSILGDI